MDKKAGCVKLEIGVESGSPRMQKIIAKDVDNDLVKRAFGLIKANGIATGAFLWLVFQTRQPKTWHRHFN